MTSRTQGRVRVQRNGFGRTLRDGLAWIVRARRTAAARKELANLSAAQLRDMGITDDMRRAELRRPFWHTR